MSRRSVDLAWIAVATVLAGALLIATLGQPGARTPDEHVLSVAATIKCPTCVGQSVAQSEAPASRDIRADIARRIALGENDDQIRNDMASRFGPDILLSPSRTGVVGLIWKLPIAIAMLVLIGLALSFRRRRPNRAGKVSDEDRLLVAAALATVASAPFDDEQLHD